MEPSATSTKQYAIHPLAGIIPEMTEQEYADLRADIYENGLRVPITLYEHQVLDGRHRLRACQELGIEPTFETYEGDEPRTYILSMNLHRRQLTTSQRAMVLAQSMEPLAEAIRARSRERSNQNLRPGNTPGSAKDKPKSVKTPTSAPTNRGTAAALAPLAKVSGSTVTRANVVNKADPDLAQRVLEGEIGLNRAWSIVKGKEERPSEEHIGKYSPRTVERVAQQAAGLAVAVDAINIRSSVKTLDGERLEKVRSDLRRGIKALNALAREAGR